MRRIIRSNMMRSTASIIFLLSFVHLTTADDSSIKGIDASWFYVYTIGIVIASILITLLVTGLAYLTLRCVKKRQLDSVYYADEVIVEKGPPDYPKENFDAVPSETQVVQIQPILTVSEVVSSIKQSLEVMGQAITPKRWLTAPPPVVEEETDTTIEF